MKGYNPIRDEIFNVKFTESVNPLLLMLISFLSFILSSNIMVTLLNIGFPWPLENVMVKGLIVRPIGTKLSYVKEYNKDI